MKRRGSNKNRNDVSLRDGVNSRGVSFFTSSASKDTRRAHQSIAGQHRTVVDYCIGSHCAGWKRDGLGPDYVLAALRRRLRHSPPLPPGPLLHHQVPLGLLHSSLVPFSLVPFRGVVRGVVGSQRPPASRFTMRTRPSPAGSAFGTGMR